MALGLVSPLLNRGVRSRWLASLPVAGSKMLTIDSNGDTSFQDVPVAAWGSITGTLSAQTDLQNALNAKLSLTGGTLTGGLYFSGAAGARLEMSSQQYTPGNVAINMPWGSGTLQGIYGSNGLVGFASAGFSYFEVNTSGLRLASTRSIAMGGTIASPEVFAFSGGSNTWEQRNSTNAQRFNLYGTYTDASNYRRLYVSSTTAGAFTIGVEGAGTGASGNTLNIGPGITIDRGGFVISVESSLIFATTVVQLNSDTGQLRGRNGRIILSDNATGSTFDLLRFGGITSSFPAIKRNGTALNFRLADDSADAPITAAAGTFSGAFTITQPVSTSGSPTAFTLTGAAHTTLTASTEATDVNFNLARTVQFAAGALTTQRAFRIQAPTYSFASASTITTASTLSISGRPISGTNATITNGYALNIESGNTILNGDLIVGVFGATFSRISFNRGVSHTFDICQPYPEAILFRQNGSGFASFYGGSIEFGSYTAGLMLSGGGLSWSSNATIGNSQEVPNLCLMRDAADTLAQRRSTNAQTFRIYNTYTDASNYIRQSLSFTTYSSTVHAQHVVEGAGTGAVNVPFVITPRGTGAFILGPMPDGTATGGNARGANAVDLQITRTTAGKVASGESTFAAGKDNVISSTFQPCGAALGRDNTVNNGGFAAGQGNTASGNAFSIALGKANTVSGGEGAFALGNQNSVTSSHGCGALGYACESVTYQSIAIGQQSRAYIPGQLAQSAGAFSVAGDNQYVRDVLCIKTTNNTPTALTTSRNLGGAARRTIPSGKLFLFTAKIVGVKSDGTSRACYVRKGAIINIAGTTSLVGTIDTVGTDVEDNAATDVAITADNTNDALDISVTGITSETWRWVAVVEGVEVAYGT